MMRGSRVEIRPGTVDDFPACEALDHRYTTTRVWQLECDDRDGILSSRFQTVRLPRPLTIPYPIPPEQRVDHWCQAHAFLIARDDGDTIGYATFRKHPVDAVVWLQDAVVAPNRRGQGVAGQLLTAGSHWARGQGRRRLMARVQTKNDPAIRFLKKHGFQFCGYNEFQYSHEAIALYFTTRI